MKRKYAQRKDVKRNMQDSKKKEKEPDLLQKPGESIKILVDHSSNESTDLPRKKSRKKYDGHKQDVSHGEHETSDHQNGAGTSNAMKNLDRKVKKKTVRLKTLRKRIYRYLQLSSVNTIKLCN